MTPTDKIVELEKTLILRDKRIRSLQNAFNNCKSELLRSDGDLHDIRQALIRIVDEEY